jgi:dehydrogenase E1 component
MRMLGHAQHDSAEYVPKAMLQAWKQRDPLDRFEKVLTEKRLWDAKTKKEIDARIASEIRADVEFAENSPFPPPESAEEGVYCEGCHMIEADWQRPREEVMPPRSSVKAEWPIKSHAANGARPPAAAHTASKAKPGKKPASAAVRVRAKAGR